MFDLSWGEIALIGIIALLVIGPKELPGVLRGLGQAVAKLRAMASDFQYQFNQALQEAEVDKVKSSIDSVNESVSKSTAFDPIDYARDKIQSTVDDVKAALNPADPAAGTIGPPTPDSIAQAIPAPPGYAVDPATLHNQLAQPPVSDAPAGDPLPLTGSEPTASPVPAPPAEAVAAETPEEPAPKPRRSRKAPSADAEAPAAPAAETPAEPVEEAQPKRARKAKE
ncbi:MAG: Sec-independent protein translocase protein TatB [Phreatobacter sp.]